MSNITRKQWNKYISVLRRINDRAAEDLITYLDANGMLDENGMVIEDLSQMQRDDLLDYAYAISAKYGNASAAISAEMYDVMAVLQNTVVPAAELAPVPTFHEVAKTVNGVLKTSHNSEELSSAVGRLVKQTGVRTTTQNAKRDKAQFAWVPSGDTCAFCIALAANGWVNARSKRHKEHIHSNCDCTYAVRFDNNSTVEGYDPKEYWNELNGAIKEYPNAELQEELGGSNSIGAVKYENMNPEVINAMRRKNYAENRDSILMQKRSAYEKRKELNSSAAEETKIN